MSTSSPCPPAIRRWLRRCDARRRLPSESPARRVADILAAIARIEAYIADVVGFEALMRDKYLHRDGVERQLLIVSEAARKLRG